MLSFINVDNDTGNESFTAICRKKQEIISLTLKIQIPPVQNTLKEKHFIQNKGPGRLVWIKNTSLANLMGGE